MNHKSTPVTTANEAKQSHNKNENDMPNADLDDITKMALAKLKKTMYLINVIVIIAIIIITERIISTITYKDMFVNAPVHPYFYLAGFFTAIILICLGLIAFENVQKNKILRARNAAHSPSMAPHVYLIGFIIGITIVITICLEIVKSENNRILKELEKERTEINQPPTPIKE